MTTRYNVNAELNGVLPRQAAAPRRTRRLAPPGRRGAAGATEAGSTPVEGTPPARPTDILAPQPRLVNITLRRAERARRGARRLARVDRRPSECAILGYASAVQASSSDLTLDSYQANGVLTYLANGLGHHVIKGGVEASSYVHTPRPYLRAAWQYRSGNGTPERAATQVNDARRYGDLTAPDRRHPGHGHLQDRKSTIIGGFLQDSWSIMDKVTLNVGLRYDTLALYGGTAMLGIALNDQWSPRIGFVYDPTQQGRAKIYANYGALLRAHPPRHRRPRRSAPSVQSARLRTPATR